MFTGTWFKPMIRGHSWTSMGISSYIYAIIEDSLRTISHWYEFEEFKAYRHLGYLIGWAYL